MKKPARDRRLYRRAIVIFLVAIMLPSLIQAYLGIRYLKQEEQRQEQLVLRSLKVTLADAARKMEESVQGSIRKMFDSITTFSTDQDVIIPQELHRFREDHDLISEVFILNNRGRLVFPRAFLDHKETGNLQLILSDVTRSSLVHGEEAEAGGKYDDAISKYSTGLAYSRYTRERLPFLVRIARCKFKSGDLKGAQENYRRILVEDYDHFYGEEIPYQFIAAFQLVKIMDKTGREKDIFNVMLTLYEKMLDHFNRFTKNQFFYYLTIVKSELQNHLDANDTSSTETLERLSRLEKLFMEEPAMGETINSTIIPSIELALLTKPQTRILRYASIENDTNSQISVAYLDLGNQAKDLRVIGAVINKSKVLKAVNDSLQKFDMGENLRMVMLNEKQVSILTGESDETSIVEEPLSLLSGVMAGNRLALIGTYGTSIKEFTNRGIKSYYAIIISIIIVIALGVFFIFHDISREQELMQMKSEFISNVTHEIKTPIATVRSLAENVNEGWVTNPDKQKEYFHLIARESERLGHLVENTLDFSRIESGSKRYYMEPSSLQEVIDKTLDRFKLLTEGQEVNITCKVAKKLPLVYLDKVAMGQALLNLLDNAAKYSPEAKIIALEAHKDGDYMKIDIIDKGIGIDKKDIPRIFDKFYRSESDKGRKITGSGIGLTLVKEIVNSHHGEIIVQSEPGRGSTFTIRIPINQHN